MGIPAEMRKALKEAKRLEKEKLPADDDFKRIDKEFSRDARLLKPLITKPLPNRRTGPAAR
ncbi:hypothetical protein JXB02_02615 [Candidatus Woesearchaeota archaeon]|nr:hypothetical protein [Candidatus Woesearchaeota archaeon]